MPELGARIHRIDGNGTQGAHSIRARRNKKHTSRGAAVPPSLEQTIQHMASEGILQALEFVDGFASKECVEGGRHFVREACAVNGVEELVLLRRQRV